MFNLIISLIIFCFALYGFSRMMLHLLYTLISDTKKIQKIPYTVLCVKNQADSIEATIRSLAWHLMSQNRSGYVTDIIVIDLGSEDETFDILMCLAREYPFLHPMSKTRYIDMVNNM